MAIYGEMKRPQLAGQRLARCPRFPRNYSVQISPGSRRTRLSILSLVVHIFSLHLFPLVSFSFSMQLRTDIHTTTAECIRTFIVENLYEYIMCVVQDFLKLLKYISNKVYTASIYTFSKKLI